MSDRPHLLIVDDDARIRALLGRFLIRNGFYATVARDAAHARRATAASHVRARDRGRPDLVGCAVARVVAS